MCEQAEAGGGEGKRSLGKTTVFSVSVGLEREFTSAKARGDAAGSASPSTSLDLQRTQGGNLTEDWPVLSKQSSRYNALW